MNIIVLGVNHKTASLDIREKLAFTEKHIEESLDILHNFNVIKERVILSTCNRVEIYASVNNIEDGIKGLKDFIYKYHEIAYGNLEDCFYTYFSEDAVEHLFKVSSSLDSMVVGEPQILGQVKDAYTLAKEHRAIGMILNQLFEKAFYVAKKVRSETRIAENAVSISYVAVELAKKIFGELEAKTVMIIGAGEMAELAARHLLSNGSKSILVSNRTFDRAVELARGFKGSAIRFESIEDELLRTDIVISSTGAPHFIIKKNMIERVIHQRRNRPMFFIDIAFPRDVEPAINEIENVYLYNIDDLQNVVTANIKERERESQKATEIIRKEVGQFLNWLDGLEITPTITALREKAEAIRLEELEEALSKLGTVSDKERLIIDNLSSAIVNKLLHAPTMNLKKQIESTDGHWYIKVVRNLFNLD
ncbi:MAG: glutamyl-tRNA reductase [Nitrospinae bacterium RIFCSPLOWO2_12_39_15]|nr:MAG: glutamyl-tRNA reductase [Nitrospinae bacterium RIFCSPLOWO2_12_39_15]